MFVAMVTVQLNCTWDWSKSGNNNDLRKKSSDYYYMMFQYFCCNSILVCFISSVTSCAQPPCTDIPHSVHRPFPHAWTFSRSVIECTATDHDFLMIQWLTKLLQCFDLMQCLLNISTLSESIETKSNAPKSSASQLLSFPANHISCHKNGIWGRCRPIFVKRSLQQFCCWQY